MSGKRDNKNIKFNDEIYNPRLNLLDKNIEHKFLQ